MTIRKKTLLIHSMLFLLLMGILVVISYKVILEGFSGLEEQHTVVNTKRVLNTFSDILSNLQSTATDWSSWDDTYKFVEDNNDAYAQGNLTDQTFINLRLNIIALINSAGEILYVRTLDLQTKEAIPLSPGVKTFLTDDHNRRITSDAGIKGFVMIDSTPVFVAVNPILKNDNIGPPKGILIFGRYLDAHEIRRLDEAAQVSVSVTPSLSDMTDNRRTEASDFSNDGIAVRPENRDHIAGFAIQKDIDDKPAFMLKVTMKRQIYHHGLNTITYYIVFLLFSGLCFIIFSLLILEKFAFAPLNRLTGLVGEISRRRDFSLKMPVSRNDELGKLSETINFLLESIQEMMGSLKESEDRLKTILDTVLAGILIIDPDTRIIVEANSAAAHMIGEKRENIIGRVCHQFICMAEENQCPVPDQDMRIDSTERILLTAQGSQIPILKSAVTVTLNHKYHLLESFMDISEWRAAETARLKNEKLLTALEVTGAVCHELNQPLAAIYGFTDLSKLKLNKTDPMWDTIDKIQKNAERIKQITHKLLRITRYETTNYAEGMKIMDIDKSSGGIL